MKIRAAFVLLAIRLEVVTYQVHGQPYESDSNGTCRDDKTEYIPEGSNLCCKRCAPGMRFRSQCNATSETECEKCPDGQYVEKYNYHKNCFSCSKCDEDKGLQYAQTCSSTRPSKCVCRTGMFCIMGFRDSYCKECTSYTFCLPGYGVSLKGSGDSDVKCAPCPDGYFSDSLSYIDACQKHTDCEAEGRILQRQGNATSDSECKPMIRSLRKFPTTILPNTSALKTTVVPPDPSSTPSSSRTSEPKTTKVPQGDSFSTSMLVPSILGAAGSVVFLIATIVLVTVLVVCNQKKDNKPQGLAETDSNGNCEEVKNGSDPQFISATYTSPEQQCLLRMEQCNNASQAKPSCDNGIGLQEGMAISGSPLQSSPPQMTSLTQPTPHPTSPQPPGNPLPSSPQVNVNITFNVPLNLEMGNGSCVSPQSPPADSSHTDLTSLDFPLGVEEVCDSQPQQEDGKEVFLAIQEKGHALLRSE